MHTNPRGQRPGRPLHRNLAGYNAVTCPRRQNIIIGTFRGQMLKQPLSVQLADGVVPLVLVLNVSTVDLPCRSGTPGGQDPPALFVWFTQLQSQAQCGGFVKLCATDKYAIQFLKLCIMENCKHTQKLTDHKSPCTPPPPPSIILNILLSCSHHSLLIICLETTFVYLQDPKP